MEIKIRCSSLSSWNDCPRRSAAKSYGYMVEMAGYTLHKPATRIYTPFGSAVHRGIETFFLNKINGIDKKNSRYNTIENAISLLQEKISGETVEWDATTDSFSTAQNQIEQMLDSFMLTFGESIIPLEKPEYYAEANIAPGVMLAGTMDIISVDPIIYDPKTTTNGNSYHGSMGGYGLLFRAEVNRPVAGLSLLQFPRVSRKKVFPGIKEIKYDPLSCERFAFVTCAAITKSLRAFEQNNNPLVFPANPMSRMCGKKFCPAFDTAWCEIHKEASVETDEEIED